ncbi:DEAD/DEAH box helicase [Actinocorallia libanotica]|uniref:DEAD/DEAH box helicase n=1 Tax=Actinocorallia libanotica TaxID=46162 RepID=UPI0031E42DA7
MLDVVLEQSRRSLETYRNDPGRIQEDANGERRISEGGYGDRQVYELVQNGADELRGHSGGRICVILTASHLYCANEGNPVTPEGAETILRMGVSKKRGGQIGRFGVGVKSVLSVSDTPEFFSREDDRSFGFDREWSANQIRSVRPGADLNDIPVLRMAQPLDRERAKAADPVLSELLGWATTVVRLPLKKSVAVRLGRDLTQFPAEFLLFSPHVSEVVLEDRRENGVARSLTQRLNDDARTLIHKNGSKTETEEWRVFTRAHAPSIDALREAGELHDRPEVDISWAVPVTGSRTRGRGQFWAYFPTNYSTTLRGILNAPWKTSEDRQNLYQANRFNDELIISGADLVVESLAALSTSQDPCVYFDFVPARGREEPVWAANDLVHKIWEFAAIRPTLADQDGVLRPPADVRLHPADLKDHWLQIWAGYKNRPKNWCHHSVERTPHRRQSAERILSTAGLEPATIREWLEALVSDGEPESSSRAILIAAEMKRTADELTKPIDRAKALNVVEQALKAKIILTEAGNHEAPSATLFRRSSGVQLADTIVYVDERVVDAPGLARALDSIGVHEADAAGRFASVVQRGFHGYDDDAWASFWKLARMAGPANALAALRKNDINGPSQLKVKTVAGPFRPLYACLMPPRIVPGDDSRDASISADMRYHADDRTVLRDMGLLDAPAGRVDPSNEAWFEEYKEFFHSQYCRTLPSNASRPMVKTMRFEGANPAGPLRFLTELSPEGRAAFLAALPATDLVGVWQMTVGKQRDTQRTIMSPLRWMARKHGYLQTSRGLKAVKHCVSPLLQPYEDLLPVARITTAIAEALRLPGTLSDLKPSVWAELAKEAAETTNDTFVGKVYALFLEADVDFPEDVPLHCRVGDQWVTGLGPHEIAVTSKLAEYDELVREGIPALLAPSPAAADQMRDTWEMLSPDAVIERDLRFVSGIEPVSLVHEFPHLKVTHRHQTDGISLLRCTELEEITRTPNGARRTTIKSVLQGTNVLVLNPKDDYEALIEVDRTLNLRLGADGCHAVLKRREQQRNNERLRKICETKDLPEKVLLLLGEESLRRGLPEGLIDSEEASTGQPPTPIRVAQLALDAHGDGILRHHHKDLAIAFPELAAKFRGDNRSVQIVNDLRLPHAFAGAKIQRPDPVITVGGPTAFPRLHPYQERLASNMFDLLIRYRAPKAMLCLPTGAGKTRVAAEAVIRVIKERGLGGRPVLWIAQSGELCEQAVQSWSFVWQKVGPEEPLTISRLWEHNQAAPVPENAHLVVATDAKLSEVLDTDSYAWLRDSAIVLIDEAHTSVTPRYTALLSTLGITHRAGARPLIGLTATPFRNFNEKETQRLVDRYGKLRLDEGIFESDDPYAELQELGVLAQVEHRELSGSTLQLTDWELKEISAIGGRLPASVEQRLADDHERTEMLLNTIQELPEDGPILLFATSVDHAKVMAAKLKGRGITAAAIDSSTPTSERRTIINAYKADRIRVITNYGVLAQGFDAPATRTVMIARPTYSPNVYQQMIGRGLRGPKNGGKETCRILDVRDNIANYDRKLAFTEFEYLWKRQ